MAEQFVFTFNGAYFKAIVNAYRQIADEFVFHFTRADVRTSMMSPDGKRLIQIVLTPHYYNAYAEEAWVRGGMDLLWGAVKTLKKADTVTVRVEEDKLYVGTIKVGDVVPEGEIFDEEKIAPPAGVELGFIQVVASGFKRVLRSVPDAEYVGFDIDEPGGHIVLGESVVDLGEPHEWLLAVSGKARVAYTLKLFIPLLVSGLIEDAYIRITDKDHVIVEYAEAQSTVRFYMAPVTGGEAMIARIVERPKPVRIEILRMGERESAVLFKAVKAIDYLTEYDVVTFDTADSLGLFWQVGYLKVPSHYLETWSPPPKPLQGGFNLKDLVKHLTGVEDLRLYYDAENRLVLWGTGPKIAPGELTALSPGVKVEVPTVEGKVIFRGPVDLILRTVDDAMAAGDDYLVFYTAPYEIEAFGRNAVYYEATFELDSFQAVEEDYVPIGSDAFGYLIGFLKNVPAPWCSVGKTLDEHVYLSCETDIGEFRAIRTTYETEEAIKAYEEKVKRPVAPPEVEKLPVAPPPPLAPPKRFLVRGETVGVINPFAVIDEEKNILMVGADKLLLLMQYPDIVDLTLLDPAKGEVAEIRSLTRAPFRFVLLNDGEISVASMGKFLSREELEARPGLLEEAQGYFLEELETLGIKPPAFELVTVYPSTHINQFTGVDKKLYGPYEAGEAALIPQENAETFVREHFASWEKLPPKPPEIPPPAVRTYAELEKGFEEKDPWDALAIFVSRFEGFKRDYSRDDLHRFLRELRARTGTESVYRFYKIYPQLKDDFVSIASMIGWIPPAPPLEVPPAPPVTKPLPPPRPPPTRLRSEEVEEVWEQFVAFAKLAEVVEPLAHRDRFMETIRTSPTVANAVERARRLVSRLKLPPPPTALPAPPLMPVPDVAEVYRRLGVPPGASVSEAAFQAVWSTIQRERAVELPKGLIRSELDYLWREFADFLGKFDMDPERHRPEFEAVINPDFNLVENLDTVMKKVHELTDSERWGPERWR